MGRNINYLFGYFAKFNSKAKYLLILLRNMDIIYIYTLCVAMGTAMGTSLNISISFWLLDLDSGCWILVAGRRIMVIG